jgi:hypothetical protein
MPHHAGQARRHRVLAWFRLPRQSRESVGHPVGDEGADVGEMVEADVFGGAFLGGEDFEKHEMSFVAQIRADNYGRLLAEGLTRFADRYGIPTEDNLVT